MHWQSLASFLGLLVSVLYQDVQGDVFLHMPRGSNNRLCGDGVNVQRNNRLFDSQNNNKGGYNVGEKQVHFDATSWDGWFHEQYYMSGPEADIGIGRSILTIEWTNQHGCNDDDLTCNIVLQYKCQPQNYADTENKMRNGDAVDGKPGRNPLPSTKRNYADKVAARTEALGSGKYGLHESYEWYDKCKNRPRNDGLFAADQDIVGKTSKHTRQNPGGTRRGYECPEERDYYPYWHPTEWTDIAVYNDESNEFNCSSFRQNSFNSESKGECLELYSRRSAWDQDTNPWKHFSKCNNYDCCQLTGMQWVMFDSYLEINDKTEDECDSDGSGSEKWGIPYRSDLDQLEGIDPANWKQCLVRAAPLDCSNSQFSRSNHLGNGIGGKALTYDWELPHYTEPQLCVFRIRYNMTTKDFSPVTTDFSYNNDANVIENDPVVQVQIGGSEKEIPLQLALNTQQTGRTFQDRSHVFELIPREENECEDKTIYNINVRGKRGNIVDAFPAVEYDFAPKRLGITSDDCVHIQWAGSNRNPSGYAGEGRDQTDRSNMVAMESAGVSYPQDHTTSGMFDQATVVRAVGQDASDALSTESGIDAAVYMASGGLFRSEGELPDDTSALDADYCETTVSGGQAGDDVTKLDCAPASLRGLLFKFPVGEYFFMSTRNNQFTNRNQKGRLTVTAP